MMCRYSQIIGVTVYDKYGGEIQIADVSEHVNISMGSIQSAPFGYGENKAKQEMTGGQSRCASGGMRQRRDGPGRAAS